MELLLTTHMKATEQYFYMALFIVNPTYMGYWQSMRSKRLDIGQEWGQYPPCTLAGVSLNLMHILLLVDWWSYDNG